MGKKEILSAIKENKPPALPLPELAFQPIDHDQLFMLFQKSLAKAGGATIVIDSFKEAKEVITNIFPEVNHVVGHLKELSTIDLNTVKDPHQLASVVLAIFKGALAVAENGAVWVHENEIIHRAAPFISTHLILLISRSQIIADMHQAYKMIQGVDYGYGVFISGPSKTADIEQSLVIGAHGPKSLTVLISSND